MDAFRCPRGYDQEFQIEEMPPACRECCPLLRGVVPTDEFVSTTQAAKSLHYKSSRVVNDAIRRGRLFGVQAEDHSAVRVPRCAVDALRLYRLTILRPGRAVKDGETMREFLWAKRRKWRTKIVAERSKLPWAKRMELAAQLRKQIIALLEQGFSGGYIERKTGLSRQRVNQIKHKEGISSE